MEKRLGKYTMYQMQRQLYILTDICSNCSLKQWSKCLNSLRAFFSGHVVDTGTGNS